MGCVGSFRGTLVRYAFLMQGDRMGELEKLRKRVADLEAKVRALGVKEKALVESEKRHKLINRLVTDRIYSFTASADGRIELGEPVLGVVGEITGYGIDETRKVEDWKKVAHPDDWPIVKRVLADVLAGTPCEVELRLVSKTGTVTWQKIIGVPEWDVEKNRLKGGYWCIKDITAQKRSEEEMLRLERLRALGQMAAGISHNLNNILTTIMGPAKLLEMAVDDPELKQETEFISRSARRARDLVRRLNEAIRGGVDPTIRAIPVDQVVDEAIDLTRSMWKDEPESRGVEIRLKAELGNAPPISGTRSGLLDVIVNLILNAVDAMPNGGEIVLRTESGEGCAVISVRDTGIGMDDDTQKRVFEPFFTTKSGIGTGLGLSTVLATVSRWGGSVAVTSSPGQGAEFTISLPASLHGEAEREESAGPVRGRRAKVLIVEDSGEIRSLLERLLSRSHEVTCVSDGEEALEAFESERYDVAVIDLGLAQIPGDAVGRILRQRDPAMATILISGWVLDDDDPRAKDFDFLMSKPFDDLTQIERLVADAVKVRDSRTQDHR
jgi:two-component system cell cycle sensor histidine kinase/response regulator CckA